MRYFVTLFLFFFLAFTLVLVTGILHPKFADEILVTMDVFGFSPEAKIEQQRRRVIESLPINSKKREILINRQVFIGATEEMVKLALGEPIKTAVAPVAADSATPARTVWLYHLAGDSRPTLMEFESGLLVDARKASNVDVE